MDSSDLGPMDDGLQDLGLPVPVQTFLWGQIAPFIRPKLGKLHEATCQVSFNKKKVSARYIICLYYGFTYCQKYVFICLKCDICLYIL